MEKISSITWDPPAERHCDYPGCRQDVLWERTSESVHELLCREHVATRLVESLEAAAERQMRVEVW